MSVSGRAEPRFRALSSANERGIRTFVRPLDGNGVPTRAVTYPHLTLPTNREVYTQVGALSLKKKKK